MIKKTARQLLAGDKSSDTLFRVMYTSHLNFSRIADRKAHLMIGINVFLLSLVIAKKKMGVLAHRHELLIPNILLVTVSLICVILALLAVRPRMTPSRQKKAGQEPVNPMFFGSYSHLTPEAYHECILRLMEDPVALRAVILRDLHGLGKSLARKYKLLSACYQVFFLGMPIVVLIYIVAEFWKVLH